MKPVHYNTVMLGKEGRKKDPITYEPSKGIQRVPEKETRP